MPSITLQRLRLLRPYRCRKVGSLIEVEDGVATMLIRKRFAVAEDEARIQEEVEPEPEQPEEMIATEPEPEQPEETIATEPEPKQPEAAPAAEDEPEDEPLPSPPPKKPKPRRAALQQDSV